MTGSGISHALNIAMRAMERVEQAIARITPETGGRTVVVRVPEMDELNLVREDLVDAMHIARCALKEETSR